MKTRQLVLTSVLIAMVTVSTYIRIHIPLGTGGLVHLGTLVSFTIALKFGARYGALSGGIGMTLFDLFSEWYVWAPATLVVRLLSGFVVGTIAYSRAGQGARPWRNLLAIMLGGTIIIVGYFLFESLVLGTGWAAIASVPGNLTQIALGLFALFILPSIPSLEDLNH